MARGYMHGKRRRRSPLKKDVIRYNGNGEKVTIDDASLSKEYIDGDGNKAQDQKNGDVLYTKPPRFNTYPIEPKRNLA